MGARPRAGVVATPAVALAAITALAGVLRLSALGRVPGNAFYDAAVRSMATSWHAFLVGAFEPGASASVDKPPVDLWLQVLSVKLLGFDRLALHLPPAIAGTLAVPLLYDVVRRVFGVPAGLLAALALAVMPISVLTARSDTMDSLMMALVVAAAWLVVRAATAPAHRLAWLCGAAAVLGLAFNVKLLEALVPLPGLLALYWLASPDPPSRRVDDVLVATGVLLVVALSWITVVSLLPPQRRADPIGSTNGSVWNVVFVFNGTQRLGGSAGAGSSPRTTHAATNLKRPLNRLIAAPQRLGRTFGLVLVPALLLGLAAVLTARRRGPPADARLARLQRGMAIGLGLWLAIGLVLLTGMRHLRPRYLETITPAVAAVLGISLARLAEALPRRRTAAAALGTAVVAASAWILGVLRVGPLTTVLVGTGALVAAGLAIAAVRRPEAPVPWRSAATAAALVALLAAPVASSVDLARSGAIDAGGPGALSARQLDALSAYLRAHQRGARYEVAAVGPFKVAALIAHDGRPILLLGGVNGRQLVSRRQFVSQVDHRQVRYALLGPACPGHPRGAHGGCDVVRWIRHHGTNVTARVQLPRAAQIQLWRVHAARHAQGAGGSAGAAGGRARATRSTRG